MPNRILENVEMEFFLLSKYRAKKSIESHCEISHFLRYLIVVRISLTMNGLARSRSASNVVINHTKLKNQYTFAGNLRKLNFVYEEKIH